MQAFFTAQMDYIFFIYGLSFFCLAITAFFLFRNNPKHKLWLWLALFGVTHGIREWLDMAVLLAPSFVLDIVRMAAMAISFICLMEAARRETARREGWMISGTIYVLWLVTPVAGWLGYGFQGADIFVRYFYGVLGGLWVAWSLWRYHPQNGAGLREIHFLRWLGLGMGLYSLTQLVPPKGPFFPADILNTSSFLAGAGFPIQLLRMLLAFTSAVIVWRYYRALRRALSPHAGCISRIRLERWLALCLTVTLLLGWVATEHVGRLTAAEEGDDLLHIAKTFTVAIAPEKLAALTGTRQDINNSEYLKLRGQAIAAGSAAQNIRYIYLFGRRDGQIFFYFDSEPERYSQKVGKATAFPGDVYEEMSPGLRAAFDKGETVFEGPSTDPWGDLVSALVPISDRQTGTVIAVLGVDMEASGWQARLMAHRLIGILLTFLLAVILMLFFIVQQRNFEIQEALRESEYKYKRLFDEMLNGFAVHEIICDSRGKPFDYRFLEVNPAFERLTGLSRQQLIGRTVREVVPDIEPEWIERYGQVALNGGVAQFEQYSAAFKRRFECRVFSPGEGKFAVTIEDITERKKVMERLTELLVRLQRQREALIGISHKVSDGMEGLAEPVKLLTEAAAKATGTERVSVWIGRRALEHLECVDLFRLSCGEHSQGAIYALEQYPTYFKALSGGNLIDAQEARSDLRTSEFAESYFKPLGIFSVLDLPVIVSTKVTGVLRFEHVSGTRKWHADEIRFAIEIAHQVEQLLLMEERREATTNLEHSYAFLQTLIDTIPNPIFFKDAELRYQGCNKAFAELLGFSKEDIIGKTVYEVAPRALAEKYEAQDRVLFTGGGTQVYEGRVRAAGGVMHDVVFYKATWAGTDGSPAGIVGVMLDVTERKRIEDALRESNARFDQIAEISREVLWETDANGLYTYVSHVAEKVYGYTAGDMVGRKHFYDLHPAEGREEFRDQASEFFRGKEILKDFVNQRETKNGQIISVATNGVPMLNPDGSLKGYRGADSERKTA